MLRNPKCLWLKGSVSEEDLWHRRFGHIGISGLMKMLRADMVKGIDLDRKSVRGEHVCEPCMVGSRMPFIEMPLPRSTRPLELVHSDVCGAGMEDCC